MTPTFYYINGPLIYLNYAKDLKNSAEFLFEIGHVLTQNFTEIFDGYPS